MRSLLLALALLLVAGLCACSTVSVTNDYDPNVDFAALKTWSWYPEAQGTDANGIVSLTSSRIRGALESDLTQRGFERVESDGQFLVAFHTVLRQKIEAGAQPYGYGWRRGYMGAADAPDIMTYDEGSLLVDFVDPKSKAMVWRGTATSVVDPKSSTEERDGLIREAVARILEQFPPAKK
jgi:Domain of unknown function (DUF4136)